MISCYKKKIACVLLLFRRVPVPRLSSVCRRRLPSFVAIVLVRHRIRLHPEQLPSIGFCVWLVACHITTSTDLLFYRASTCRSAVVRVQLTWCGAGKQTSSPCNSRLASHSLPCFPTGYSQSMSDCVLHPTIGREDMAFALPRRKRSRNGSRRHGAGGDVTCEDG